MKYKLIIFDMDGLMFDTELMYYNSWFEFTDKYDFNFDENMRTKLVGKNEEAIRNELIKLLGSEEEVKMLRKDLNAYRRNYFKTYTTSLKKEGLQELLDFAKGNRTRRTFDRGGR